MTIEEEINYDMQRAEDQRQRAKEQKEYRESIERAERALNSPEGNRLMKATEEQARLVLSINKLKYLPTPPKQIIAIHQAKYYQLQKEIEAILYPAGGIEG